MSEATIATASPRVLGMMGMLGRICIDDDSVFRSPTPRVSKEFPCSLTVTPLAPPSSTVPPERGVRMPFFSDDRPEGPEYRADGANRGLAVPGCGAKPWLAPRGRGLGVPILVRRP
jgi:hypothetical protein